MVRVPKGIAKRIAQDSSVRAIDSTPKPAAGATAVAQPTEMRTPQNVGFLEAAYVVAGTIYALYLVTMFRRWAALRSRQRDGASRSGH